MLAQATQSSFEAAPFVEYLPAAHDAHWSLVANAESKYLPGEQDEQLDEPAMLWPLPQLVQVSVAPVLNVFTGQTSKSVRSALALVPATTVTQYAAAAAEYFPLVHSVHAVIVPPKPDFPAAQSEHVRSLVAAQAAV